MLQSLLLVMNSCSENIRKGNLEFLAPILGKHPGLQPGPHPLLSSAWCYLSLIFGSPPSQAERFW